MGVVVGREAQGQPRSALTELRLLLTQAASAHEELRYLREVVRLDPKDEVAATRLRTLSATAAAEGEDDDEPETSSGADTDPLSTISETIETTVSPTTSGVLPETDSSTTVATDNLLGSRS